MPASAQGDKLSNTGSIYRCTDARGRVITSDRPIAACLDREQVELGASGTTKRIIEPAYSAEELAAREERRRQAALAAERERDEQRQDRALLIRYPDDQTHERERAEVLDQIDAAIAAARKRLAELAEDRRAIDLELEFYRGDPMRAPAALRRQLEDNDLRMATQHKLMAQQQAEKQRVNQRFDAERARLQKFWAQQRRR